MPEQGRAGQRQPRRRVQSGDRRRWWSASSRRRTGRRCRTAGQALDRVLLWNRFVVTEWYIEQLPHGVVGQVRPSRHADPRGLQLRLLVGRSGQAEGARCRARLVKRRNLAALPAATAAAGRAHAVRHHRDQLRRRAVRPRWPGGAGDRRPEGPRRDRVRRDQLGRRRRAERRHAIAARAGHRPADHRRDQKAVRLRQAAARTFHRHGQAAT